MEYEFVCKVCGKKFKTNNPRKKTCSTECSKRNNILLNIAREKKRTEEKQRQIVICEYCGKPFVKGSRQKYCSDVCSEKMANAILDRRRGKSLSADSVMFESERIRREKRKPKIDISDIKKQAEEKGMTYGQYVAWLDGYGRLERRRTC